MRDTEDGLDVRGKSSDDLVGVWLGRDGRGDAGRARAGTRLDGRAIAVPAAEGGGVATDGRRPILGLKELGNGD